MFDNSRSASSESKDSEKTPIAKIPKIVSFSLFDLTKNSRAEDDSFYDTRWLDCFQGENRLIKPLNYKSLNRIGHSGISKFLKKEVSTR